MSKQASIIIPEGCKKVLLHACCAPCSSAILEWLLGHGIEPVIYYYNPNIYPREEYEIRKAESQRQAKSSGIRWIEGLPPCDSPEKSEQAWGKAHSEWLEAVRGLENEPERGKRCEQCFYYRLQATARQAQKSGIEWFATTLASSRWKNIDQVNSAGIQAARENVHFWAQNWRKDGLQERRNALLREYKFYNQLYCGCEFSQRCLR